MIDAHRQFWLMRRYGWSFGRCLSFAWAKAREPRGAALSWRRAADRGVTAALQSFNAVGLLSKSILYSALLYIVATWAAGALIARMLLGGSP
jgi:hypothetical protein